MTERAPPAHGRCATPLLHTGRYYTDSRTGKQEVQAYTADVPQWMLPFRSGALTLAWSEDWIWQTPVGTQQMMGLSLDVFRSALSRDGGRPFKNPPDTSRPAAPILMYIMAHFPGNTARSWTRQLWSDLAHGVKIAQHKHSTA